MNAGSSEYEFQKKHSFNWTDRSTYSDNLRADEYANYNTIFPPQYAYDSKGHKQNDMKNDKIQGGYKLQINLLAARLTVIFVS